MRDEQLEKALSSSPSGQDLQRLKAIRMVLNGVRIDAIAVEVDRSKTQIRRWLNAYRESGVEGLLRRKKALGNKPRLCAKAIEEMANGLKNRRWNHTAKVREWLENAHGIKLTLSGTQYWVTKLGGIPSLEVRKLSPELSSLVLAAKKALAAS